MPRARRTQPVEAPTGRAYGERQALEQSQRDLPLPQQAPPPAPAATPMRDPAQALAEFPFPEPMLPGPTARPHEPITAGLPVGPGPGPEAAGGPAPVAQAYRDLAAQTKDPDLAYLADLVGRLGL
jgi:hypothetical protein